MRLNAKTRKDLVLKLAAGCSAVMFAVQMPAPATAETGSQPELLNKSLATPHRLQVGDLLKDWPAAAEQSNTATDNALPQAQQPTSAPLPGPEAGASTDAGASDKSLRTGSTAGDTKEIEITSATAEKSEPAADSTSEAKPVSIATTTIAPPEVAQPKPDITERIGPDKISLDLPANSVLGMFTPTEIGRGNRPIVIDNDEVQETKATIEYADLPTDEGKTRVKTGARFPVVVTSEFSSKTAKLDAPIQARLKYDLKIGDRLIAPKGAQVIGHINYVLKARTPLHSLVSPERWYRNSGCLGLSFDEIINEKGEHLPLVAMPARQARVVKNKGEGRELGVNHNGQVTGPWSQQLKYKAIRIGLNAALSPAGVFSFGAMPVALGVMGAACPSFAFMKPVGLNVRHRRLKGFAWGFLSGIPGSWLIEDTTLKGQEAVIKPGDEFLVEFQQEFTGEPATDAQLIPGANTKVKGQIISGDKRSKKKK